MKQKVSSPGVPDHPRLAPPGVVEHPANIVDLLGDVDRAAGRGSWKPSLLVGSDFVAVADVIDRRIEVDERKPRASVEHQDRWPTAGSPTAELPGGRWVDYERLPHSHSHRDWCLDQAVDNLTPGYARVSRKGRPLVIGIGIGIELPELPWQDRATSA